MATKYSTQYDQAYITKPFSALKPNEQAGRVRCAYAKYSFSADLAAADVINMFKLPKGARIVDAILKTPDLDASGGTLDVGYDSGLNGDETADPDGLFVDVDVTSAALTRMLVGAAAHFRELLDEVNVQITIDGDTDATSGDVFLAVFYVLD